MKKGTKTRLRILDAAEQLFPDAGIHGVTMRGIAERADVGLGVLTYHFASKEAVFREVLARRAIELNSLRRQCLNELADDAGLEDVLHAFLYPYLKLVRDGGPGWRAYGRLVVQSSQSVYWAEEVSRHFKKVSQEIIQRMIRAEPTLSNTMAVRAFVHTVSVMIGVLAPTGQLDRYSNGRISCDDLDGAYRPMLAFVVGGIRAVCGDSEILQEMTAELA